MPTTDPHRILFTVANLCQATGLGRTTVYAQIKRGLLRAHKCGRRTLFSSADVAAWLNNLPEMLPRDAGHYTRDSSPSAKSKNTTVDLATGAGSPPFDRRNTRSRQHPL
jgi:excisionase family DNA binding protein